MIRNLLRFLGWVCLLVLLSAGVLGLVYVLSERPQKISIEHRVLNVVDTVREDGTTPRRVVDALDRVHGAHRSAAVVAEKRRGVLRAGLLDADHGQLPGVTAD